MPIRAIALDIDGTMTDYERRLDWDGVAAIRAAEAKGVPVIAATGNVGPVTKAFCDYVGTSGPAVCENGGVVYDRSFKKSHILAERKNADRAVRQLLRKGFDARYIASNPWRVSEVALELNLDVRAVQEALKRWDLTVLSTRFAIHIMEPGLDKANGLKVALQKFGGRIPLKDVLAIGDSNNDVGLFRRCGQGGAPSNCTDSVRAVAQYVSNKKHGAGVRDALEHFGVL